MNTPVYEPTEMCEKCGGMCCRKMGCHYSPSDFADLSFEGLKKELEKGRISIDWWESKDREYFLRARNVGEPIVFGSWGGVCVNLTDSGCILSWDERPLGGKALKPRDKYASHCINSYTKADCKDEWKAYSAVLQRLVEYFKGNTK